jgi:hypothetical protein
MRKHDQIMVRRSIANTETIAAVIRKRDNCVLSFIIQALSDRFKLQNALKGRLQRFLQLQKNTQRERDGTARNSG